MSLPKFTAEASLYPTTRSYQFVAKEAVVTERQAIIPQANCWYNGSYYSPGQWICVNRVAYACYTDGYWRAFSFCN